MNARSHRRTEAKRSRRLIMNREISRLSLTLTVVSLLILAYNATEPTCKATEPKDSVAKEASEATVERIGPPTFFAPPIERYRLGAPDLGNPDFYPVPQTAVTRDTYMDWLERSGLLDYAQQPKRGMSGPTLLLPSLAKYVQSGQRHWGEACIVMLKDYHRALKAEIKQKGWVEQFAEPPAFLPVYREHLIAGGLMNADDSWFRELWLDYCRYLHVWGTEPIEWRGPCHRSMPEALAKGLAAKWYPDIPEAAHWREYSLLVWDDFWRVKDLLQNDTGYFQDSVRAYAFSGDQLVGDDRYLSDSGMQKIWDRLMAEITPDGAINPYGPNGGWNSTAALRVGVLEAAARATGNGEYRYAAHKAMNYLLYQNAPTLRDGYLKHQETAPYIVLAWLAADETIKPVEPGSGGMITYRREPARYPHRDKAIVGRFLPNLDPDPDKANLCCNYAFTDRTIADKLVLRSGWNPGDLFVLVELAPTTFPYNAGGIVGMTRWGAPFTQVVTSKGETPENRLWVTDVSEKAQRRYIADPDRINEVWERGKMQDMMTSVPLLRDTPEATFARVVIQNPEGLPVRVVQEYVFVKNRFLVRREILEFEEAFDARVASIWNTQNVGPFIGNHWANTFLDAPVASNGKIAMYTPPADLLVYFAPQADWRMQVVDRTAEDPRTEVCPAQVRYVWEGKATAGQRLHVTEVFYPHAARKAPPVSNNPRMKDENRDAKLATLAGASGIQVIQDKLDGTVLRFEFQPGHVEWVAFNPDGQTLHLDSLKTNEDLVYHKMHD